MSTRREARPSLPMGTAGITETDDLALLFDVLPAEVRQALGRIDDAAELIEIVLDLGRRPEARFPDRVERLGEEPVTPEEIAHVVDRIGRFGKDNRAGIERTLHRISAIRNRLGEVVGLTCRVGRAVFGTLDILRDVIERGDSILLLGRPGVGKTTLLREAARVLSDELGLRVIVVDTSNEIAGDGDIPHPGIGGARRMQVAVPEAQHSVMIEAVENHMPEVVVIDEIGTAAEALAARTIAERGVQLVATAHGNTLDNLIQNPTLADLVGGVHAVTLSDEEARRRGTRKTVLERKAPPTFDVVVEIHDPDRLAVHHDVADVIDRFLRGARLTPEARTRDEDGSVRIEAPPPVPTASTFATEPAMRRTLRVFPYAISRSKIERAVRELGVPVIVVDNLKEAQVVLTTKAQDRRQPKKLRDAATRGLRVEVLRANTIHQVESFLRTELGLPEELDERDLALREAEMAAEEVLAHDQPVELAPQDRFYRRLQHELVRANGLLSESRGDEPYRRVVVLPPE